MNPKLRLAIAALSTGFVFYIAVGSFPLGRVMGDTTYGQLALFNEVIRIVLDNYVEAVDVDRAMGGAKLGLTEALDGDSAYLDAEEYQSYLQGAKETGEVGLLIARRFSFVIVSAVRPGSPADKAGMHAGDVIKSIDGHYARTLSYPVAERLLRGAPGSVLKLKLLRAQNETTDVDLVRERLMPVKVESRMLEDGIGYVKVQEFSHDTTDEVRSALETLKRGGAKRLVLDVRGGAHGSAAEAVPVASLFLKEGVVTKLVSRKGTGQSFNTTGSMAWDLPLVVLTNTSTAGPGEILAAALADAGRPLVGERTFGRAATQKIVPIADGAVVLTVAKYVSPKGVEIHGKGLEPKFPVQVRDDADEDQPAGAATLPDDILLKGIEVVKSDEKKAADAVPAAGAVKDRASAPAGGDDTVGPLGH
jgi:carboxyl-terminal processing protease